LASFSPTEAAFTGFRVVREHPKAVIGWAVLQFGFSLTTTLALIGFAGPSVARFQAEGFKAFSDPAAATAMLHQMLPAYGLIVPICLIIYPLFNAAMNRAVLRPQDDRFCYLRLGADELRQLGLILLCMVLAFAAELALSTVALAVSATLSAVLGSVAGGLGAMVILVAGLFGVVFVAVRLSLASALTFATERVDLFGAWAVTRGHTLPILVTFFLALVTSAAAAVLGIVMIYAVIAAMSGGLGGLTAALSPSPSSIATFLTPPEMVFMVLMAGLNGLMLPLMLTPPAAIYQSLAIGGSQALVKDVFA
jgi:hypothetical protein